MEPEHGPCVLCLEHLSLLNKRIDAGLLSGPFGEALSAGAVRRRADQQQQRDKLEAERLAWQLRLLPGPALPQPDPRILQLYHSFTSVLKQQRWQPHEDKPPRAAGVWCVCTYICVILQAAQLSWQPDVADNNKQMLSELSIRNMVYHGCLAIACC
jgi:hypothetical protein